MILANRLPLPATQPAAANNLAPMDGGPAPFQWGANGERLTPSQIAADRAIAANLMAGTDQPITNWAQGAAHLVDAWHGGFLKNRANEQEKLNTQMMGPLMAMGGNILGQPAPAAPAQPAANPVADAGGPFSGVFPALKRIFG